MVKGWHIKLVTFKYDAIVVTFLLVNIQYYSLLQALDKNLFRLFMYC